MMHVSLKKCRAQRHAYFPVCSAPPASDRAPVTDRRRDLSLIPGCATSPRSGSTRAAKTSLDANSTARVDPTAPKVAPASRKADPPGSECPPDLSAVCAVDAELKAASIAVKGDPCRGCSGRCFGTKVDTTCAGRRHSCGLMLAQPRDNLRWQKLLSSGPESWVAMPSRAGLQGRGYEFLILKPGKRPMEKGFLRVVHFSLNDRYSL
jgi:hypothetical protein